MGPYLLYVEWPLCISRTKPALVSSQSLGDWKGKMDKVVSKSKVWLWRNLKLQIVKHGKSGRWTVRPKLENCLMLFHVIQEEFRVMLTTVRRNNLTKRRLAEGNPPCSTKYLEGEGWSAGSLVATDPVAAQRLHLRLLPSFPLMRGPATGCRRCSVSWLWWQNVYLLIIWLFVCFMHFSMHFNFFCFKICGTIILNEAPQNFKLRRHVWVAIWFWQIKCFLMD